VRLQHRDSFHFQEVSLIFTLLSAILHVTNITFTREDETDRVYMKESNHLSIGQYHALYGSCVCVCEKTNVNNFPPIGFVIKNLKNGIKAGKKVKSQKELLPLIDKIETLLNNIDYANLQAGEIHQLLQLEEPIYNIFGLKLSDYRDSFLGDNKGTEYDRGLGSIKANNAHLQPTDIIEQLSGAEVGSPEYMETKIN